MVQGNEVLVLQNVPYKIMVLGEGGQVVVAAALDADKGDFIGVDLLQVFAVADGDEPVFCAVNDISMAVDAAYPFIGAQFVTKHQLNRAEREESALRAS